MKRIIGSPYNTVTRAVDMLCLALGKTLGINMLILSEVQFPLTGIPEYSLHIQTQWRFVHNQRIILASRDIYEPYSDKIDENWDYSEVGRPDNKSSIFDVKIKDFDRLMEGSFVSDCRVSELGDICIVFSNGVIFESFISGSVEDEEWRLIDYSRDEHIIFHDI